MVAAQAGAGARVEDTLVANNRGRGVVLRASNSTLARSAIWSPKFWGVQARCPWKLSACYPLICAFIAP